MANLLAEHQPAVPETKPGYNPTEPDEADVRLVEKLLAKAKKARGQYDWKWVDNYKMFRGKQWKHKRPTYRHSEVFNLIFAEVQTILAILTDVRPNIEALPEDPSDYEFAQIVSDILTSKWDSNNWSYTVAENITDACIYGTSIACIPWKPELLDGLGDFAFESEDILNFYPDPNARSKVNDEYCDFTVTAVPTDLYKMKAKYPDVAEFLSADVNDMEGRQLREEIDEIRYRSPTDNRGTTRTDNPNMASGGKSDQILVLTAYVRSNEVEEESFEDTDPASGQIVEQFRTKKRYPNGRKIVVANGVLCESGDNPYQEGRFPYSRLVDHAIPRQFWGVGEVEQLESSQNVVNNILSHVLDILKLCANPVWIVDTESGVEDENITNRPGLVITKNKGGEVRREMGVNIPPFVLDTLNIMMDRVMTKLSSSSEVSRGAAPSANASGYAIEQLQEATQTKLRSKSRNIEVFLKETGDLMFDRLMQYYSVPRVVRLSSNPNAAKYFKFFIKDSQDESGEVQKTAVYQPIETDADGQQIAGDPREMLIKSRVDIKFSVGTTLPFAKAQKAALAEKLYDKGIIDVEEYLTQIDYPNKDEIIAKLKANPPVPPGAPPPQGAPAPAPAA